MDPPINAAFPLPLLAAAAVLLLLLAAILYKQTSGALVIGTIRGAEWEYWLLAKPETM